MSALIEPWAMVPERAIGLNATEYDVFVAYSSKGGRSREAWVSQSTAAMLITREREAKGKPGVSRQTVGRSVKRLVAHGLMREAGIVVNKDGIWTKKYEVAPYLGVAHPVRASFGSVAKFDGHDAHFDGSDAHFDDHDAHPERAQSIASKAVPLNTNSKARISKNGNADVRDTEEPEPKPAAKTKPRKPETPEDWERARAKINDPAFLALVAEEEARKAVTES